MHKSQFLDELSQALSSSTFFLSKSGKQEFLAELFLIQKNGFMFDEMPTYGELSDQTAKVLAEESNIPLTVDYTNAEIENESIAYYRIKGMIMGESYWRFSTKQFVDDVNAAEENPMIMCHFAHVNSGGGDTWYLDKAWETLMKAKKPKVAIVERVGASAAIYLICPFDKIYAATQNEILGSIGTMVSFLDWDAYYETFGLKLIEEYATKSTLKNKKFNNLKNGKPEQFVNEELDPLRDQFETAVRTARKKTDELHEDHPLFLGETFSTAQAIDLGLIDAQKTLSEALNEAYKLGKKYLGKKQSVNTAHNYLNNL
jgi:ClpP class serine protease